jgi:gas vesicle protein
MNNTGKMIAGVATGLAVGTILGVILAPDKGSITIKKISDGSKKMAEDLLAKSKDKMEYVKDNISGKIVELTDNLSDKVMAKADALGKELSGKFVS